MRLGGYNQTSPRSFAARTVLESSSVISDGGVGLGRRERVAQARLERRQAIRLDCGAEREKLRKIYETYGFQLVDVKQVGRFYSALYQLPLTES